MSDADAIDKPHHTGHRARLGEGFTKNRAGGFTLIELSIVLVIIGLLVGGVLTGRELIKAAEMRQVVSKAEALKTAAMTFKLKYDCIPGDCKNAATFGLGSNGDGDDYITKNDGCDLIWDHLKNARLFLSRLTGPGKISFFVCGPNDGAAAGDPVQTGPKANPLVIGRDVFDGSFCPDGSEDYLYCTGISAADAAFIDQKMDDGMPMTGNVVAAGNFNDATEVPYLIGATSTLGGNPNGCVAIIDTVPSPLDVYNINNATLDACAVVMPLGL